MQMQRETFRGKLWTVIAISSCDKDIVSTTVSQVMDKAVDQATLRTPTPSVGETGAVSGG